MDRAKLDDIAQHAGTWKYSVPPLLTIPNGPEVTSGAIAQSRELLARLRREDPNYKPPETKFSRHFKTQWKREKLQDFSTWKFSQLELNAALDHAIRTDSPAAVVGAIIKAGGLPVLARDLPIVVLKWRGELTSLILRNCGHPSQDVLNICLDLALQRFAENLQPGELPEDYCAVLTSLLAAGAQMDSCKIGSSVAALEIVSRRHKSLLQLVLRSPASVQFATLAQCLETAVATGDYGIVATLLAYGADPDSRDAASFELAVIAKRYDIGVALIANSAKSLSPAHLEMMISVILSSIPPSEDSKWFRLLLYAGVDARTWRLTDRLRRAVEAGEQELIAEMVGRGTSISGMRYSPLRAAVSMSDIGMIKMLLKSKTCTAAVAELLPLVATKFDPAGEIEVTQLMIEAGALGRGLDERLALLVSDIVIGRTFRPPSAMQTRHLNVLLKGGASVDHNDGKCLNRALSAGNLFLVEHLCRAKPSQETLSAALLSIYSNMQNLRIPNRLQLTTRLLQTGVEQDAMDSVLRSVVDNEPDNTDLARLLVATGAKIAGYDGEITLKKAFGNCDDTVFDLLTKAATGKEDILGKVLPQALSQISKAKILLVHGCPQGDVDHALLDELRRPETRNAIVDLLLSHRASVDQDTGLPLVLACKKGNVSIIRQLLDTLPTCATIGEALKALARKSYPSRIQVAGMLLDWKPDQAALDTAMIIAVTGATKSTQNKYSPAGSGDKCHPDEQSLVIAALLSHGASTDYDRGKALRIATASGNVSVLEILLDRPPCREVWADVFNFARSLPDSARKLGIYGLLLKNTNAAGPQINGALVDTVCQKPVNMSILSLLLKHHASVEYQQGDALMIAIRAFDVAAVQLLLQNLTLPAVVLSRAVLIAMEIPEKHRVVLMTLLLEAGAKGDYLDEVVERSIIAKDEALVGVLLKHHSDFGSRSLEGFKGAALRGDSSMARMLTNIIEDRSIFTIMLHSMLTQRKSLRTDYGIVCAQLLLTQDV